MRGSFQETAPRKNTVKHCDGGVGSMVANHHDGGESLVVVTTLALVVCIVSVMSVSCYFITSP